MAENALVAYLESPEFIGAATNATRLVAKLKTAVQKRELYETHQILRTINFRFISVKDKAIPLSELLYQGACYLLECQEFVSGQDIATLFLESSVKCLQYLIDEKGELAKINLANQNLEHHVNNQTLHWSTSQKVSNLAVHLPDSEIGRTKFIADALRILSPKLLNRSLFHEVLAIKFWEHKEVVSSRYHYLHCASIDNAQEIARLLVEYQSGSASKSEIDLFITQFILQFLCLQSPLDSPKLSNQKSVTATTPQAAINRKTRSVIKSIAEKIFRSYTLKHPLLSQVCLPFSSLPLLNFTHFIVSILDSDKEANTFSMLCDIYRVTWARDPNYKGYLTRIGTLYFGVIDQSKQVQGGIFNNILLSLLEGADEDEEDSNHEGNNFSSCDELD